MRAAAKNFRDVNSWSCRRWTTRVCSRLSIARAGRRQRSVSSSRGAPLRIPVPTIRRLPPHSTACGSKTTCSHARARPRRCCPNSSPLPGTRFGICATARTHINRPPGTLSIPARGLGAASILQGKELSFTNLLDLDAAARIVLEFDEPAASVIKHTNPCGAATGASIVEGQRPCPGCRRPRRLRRHCRSQSGTRRRHGSRCCLDLHRSRDCAVGGGSGSRVYILRTKANMRVVTTDFTTLAAHTVHQRDVRSVLGGILVQQRAPKPSRRVRRGHHEV